MSYKREGGQNLERSYAEVMRDNLKLVHGKDAQDFKYFPKFLGVCLQRLEAGSPMTLEYLQRKLKESRSLEVRQSKVPQTLSRIQDDILLDNWSKLEAVDD